MANVRDLRVVIVGAGVSGIAAAVRVRDTFGRDARVRLRIRIVEKNASIGGTWYENTYPGAACDVPSHLYCFSFAPNAAWTSLYAPQEEIRAYMQRVADDMGVTPLVSFNMEFVGAAWDEAARVWRVRTRTVGSTVCVREDADVLVVSSAALNRAHVPAFPGMDEFLRSDPSHAVWHTSKWNHAYKSTGKRVAVIGTGASAVQVVPQLARECSHLTVLQRTPGWAVPRHNYAYSSLAQWCFAHVPGVTLIYRMLLWLQRELLFPAFREGTLWARVLKALCMQHIGTQVPDPALAAAVTPTYPPGCKRLLVTDDYFPALSQPNVSLVTAPIQRFTARGIMVGETPETCREVAVDAVVMATGFQVSSFLTHLDLVDRAGVPLRERWRSDDDVSAYMGTMITGMPNAFVLLGPNTALGHSSVIFTIETQVDWMCKVLSELVQRRATSVDVLPSAHKKYNDWLQSDLKGTVWAGSCNSWYKTASGRIVTLWPHSLARFWWTLLWPRHHELSYQ